MSLSENLYNLGALMKTNLEEKGIDGLTGNEGLTTLANKILDVEPSVAGLELSTSIDCNVSSNEVVLGHSVVFSATLFANYDDTSIEDIDISGVLTGATVLFKTSDGTIIGSGVTDVNGVATYTHTFKAISKITVYSEFEGSTNFSSCISQNNVTVSCNYTFDVTVDKDILSATDNDVATFNCRLSDGTGGAFGEPIDYQILHNDTVLSSGSKDTNVNGEITLEYAATGVGNVEVIFSYGALLQKTFVLEDCIYYSESETTCNPPTNNYVTIADLSDMTLPSKFELSMDYKTNYEGRCGLFNKATFTGNPNYSSFIGSPNGTQWYYGYRTTSTTTADAYGSPTTYHTYTISRNENTFTYNQDDSSNYTKSITWFDSYHYVIGIMMWGTNKNSSVKNIKLKAL